jgi:hypothetical protein
MEESAEVLSKPCPNCSGGIEQDSRFCKHCGFDLTVFPKALEETGEQARVPTSGNPARRKSLTLALLAVALIVLAVLIGGSFVLYKRNRGQASTTAVSNTPPIMSDRAVKMEQKILRGETLTNNDIAGLSGYELRVLRNVHFARYGRKYEQPGLGDYFITRPWYKPNDNYSDNVLTATDKANINLIVAIEKQQGSSSTVASNNNSVSISTSNNQTTETPTSSNAPANSLTNGNVEAAVRQMLSSLTQGGSVTVQGVQELPQENAAVADVVFSQFKYAADNFGTPVAASKYHPKPLPRDRIPTPDEMFQPRLTTYSGAGRAVLKHYNNNQWTLKQVNWGSMGVGWQGNVVVH